MKPTLEISLMSQPKPPQEPIRELLHMAHTTALASLTGVHGIEESRGVTGGYESYVREADRIREIWSLSELSETHQVGTPEQSLPGFVQHGGGAAIQEQDQRGLGIGGIHRVLRIVAHHSLHLVHVVPIRHGVVQIEILVPEDSEHVASLPTLGNSLGADLPDSRLTPFDRWDKGTLVGLDLLLRLCEGGCGDVAAQLQTSWMIDRMLFGGGAFPGLFDRFPTSGDLDLVRIQQEILSLAISSGDDRMLPALEAGERSRGIWGIHAQGGRANEPVSEDLPAMGLSFWMMLMPNTLRVF